MISLPAVVPRALACLLFAICAQTAWAGDFFTLKGHGGPIKGIDTGADGAIVTASFDNSVGLWREGAPQWLEAHTAAVNAVAVLPDGRIASGGDDFALYLWQNGAPRKLGVHTAKIIQIDVAPDGRRIASASWDRTAQIWDLENDAGHVVLRGHRNIVNDVEFSPDGERIYTASADGSIRVWDAATGAGRAPIVEHGFGINTLVLAPDESWIAYGAIDGGTRVVSLPDGAVLGDFTLDRRPVLAMAYHAEAARVAVGDAHGYIMMLDTNAWRIADDFRATFSGPVWALAFSPDGRNIHAGGLDNALYSWPVDRLGAGGPMTDTARSFLRAPEEMSNGERQFQRKCSICHTLTPGSARRAGPSLYGLFGRPAGSVADYTYSPTLLGADLVWSEKTIDALFDVGPDHFIPGSKMPMQRITSVQDRADLIAFLRAHTAHGTE